MIRWFSAALVGAGMALLPIIALAEGPAGSGAAAVQGRDVAPPHDMSMILLVTALGLVALFMALGIGYLYRRERRLDWAFQAPDAPHDDHH